MTIDNFSYSVNNNIVTASANIDGIQYDNITPKFFANKEIFNSNNIDVEYYNHNDIKYKSSTYTTPGINAIDIDWNDAVINNNKTTISTTSDLLTALNLAYTHSSAVSDGTEWWDEY